MTSVLRLKIAHRGVIANYFRRQILMDQIAADRDGGGPNHSAHPNLSDLGVSS